jgi:PKD domain
MRVTTVAGVCARIARAFVVATAMTLAICVAIAVGATVARAQDNTGVTTAPGGMDSGDGVEPGSSPGDSMNSDMQTSDPSMPPPMAKMHVRSPITGSMMAAPPYGLAPLKIGFFVLADDPEGIGFLTYSWNFGDGTVSSLPPELYIFHTYQNPGTYSCELTITTVDGRAQTFRQGVVVKAAGD